MAIIDLEIYLSPWDWGMMSDVPVLAMRVAIRTTRTRVQETPPYQVDFLGLARRAGTQIV